MRKMGGARRKEIPLRVGEYAAQSVPPFKQVLEKYKNIAQMPRINAATTENNNRISAALKMALRAPPVYPLWQDECNRFCDSYRVAGVSDAAQNAVGGPLSVFWLPTGRQVSGRTRRHACYRCMV